MPFGRGGAGGNSPAAIRSVQSAYTFSERSLPCVLFSTEYIDVPRTPVPSRHSQASCDVFRFGIALYTSSSVRVSWLPS